VFIEALRSSGLFAALPDHLLERLDELASPRMLLAGEWLFKKDDEADRLAILTRGRLEVLTGDRSRHLGPGSLLGEISFLTGAPRGASVRALRDSIVIELAFEDVRELVDHHPPLSMALARLVARRLGREDELQHDAPASVFALVALGGADSEHLCDEIADTFRTYEDTAVLTNERELGASLARLEQDHRCVLVHTDADLATAWAAFALRQADRIVVVVDSDASLTSSDERLNGCDLVLAAPMPAGATGRWLNELRPCVHYLVERGDPAAARRCVRGLLGRSIGVVLSGGGARALSHIGVLEELCAADIEIDRVGGCSMGAFVAALFAGGYGPTVIHEICRQALVHGHPFSDYTVPRFGLIKARRAHKMLRDVFGDVLLEELNLPAFTVSADLVAGELIVHRRGPVHDAVAASMSLPGLVPPMSRGERLLVDGGVLDNLPVDVMAVEGRGPIIAVDVVRRVVERAQGAVPTIVDTLARATVLGSLQRAESNRSLAQAVISPDIADIGLLEFKALDRAVEAGRRAARNALAEGLLAAF
jgi:predicted acylesterase/phospholipase RssA